MGRTRARLIYFAYRGGAAFLRALPGPVGRASPEASRSSPGPPDPPVGPSSRRTSAGCSVRRRRPRELRRTVRRAYASYAAVLVRSGPPRRRRIPPSSAGVVVVRHPERFHEALARGRGLIIVLPHVGCWEAGAIWTASLGYPLLTVGEVLEPPELFDWFVKTRKRAELTVLPPGPATTDAAPRPPEGRQGARPPRRSRRGRRRPADRVLRRQHADPRRPGGARPASPARRCCPPRSTSSPGAGSRSSLSPELDTTRTGNFRADVARLTRDMVAAFEQTDRLPAGAVARLPAGLAGCEAGAGRMRIALVSAYDLAVPGGVQAQVIGLGPRAASPRATKSSSWLPERPAHRPLADLDLVWSGRSVPVPGERLPRPGRADAGGDASNATARSGSAAVDVVHVHEPLVPGPALAAASWHGAPVVGTFHRARASAAYVVYGHALRRVVRDLDDRVAVSDVARATLWAAAGPCDVAILANAVDAERFAHAASAPTDVPTVLFVGRAEHRKGLAVLLEAFAGLAGDLRLQHRRRRTRGPGAAAPLRRRPADLEWLGRLPDEELAAHLAAARGLRRAGARRRVLRGRPARGHGGRDAGPRLGHPGLPARRRRRRRPVPARRRVALRHELSALLGDAAERDRPRRAGRLVAARHSFADLAAAYEAAVRGTSSARAAGSARDGPGAL